MKGLKMKKIIKGWIGKGETSLDDICGIRKDAYETIWIDKVYQNRDGPDSWDIDDWPPNRITITIEVKKKGGGNESKNQNDANVLDRNR